jgi:uncharacterized membrane-anchored protein
MTVKWMLFGLLAVAGVAGAQDAATPPADAKAPEITAEQFVEKLHFTKGDVALPAAKAHLNLGPEFQYLDHDQARSVLEQLWGNPPDDSVLGLVVPTETSLADPRSWAVVVTYSDEGYVSDEDAAKIDYADMLKQMQDATREQNPEREKAGYGTLDLVGWAEPPHYDAKNKKLYWAKELAFKGASDNTVNYDIRVLGRSGYLSLNAVAGKSDIVAVRTGMQQLLPTVEFDAGQRYADYDPKTDKLAAYGIAALIGGGIAAKAGLFAKLGVLLLAAKKFVVFILVGLFAGIKKLFGKKDKPTVVS